MTDTPFAVVARLGWTRARTGAFAWGLLFATTVIAVVASYAAAYGSEAERNQLLAAFAANKGITALFGIPRQLNTVGGFTAWRSMGFLPLMAAAWGLVVATGALRGEEELGRRATVLSGAVGRGPATVATLSGLGLAALALFMITAAATVGAALIDGSFSEGSALFLALGCCVAALPFMALGAFTSQISPTRRQASGIAAAVLGIAYVMRVAADADSSLGWLRWLTPIGWVEELRPITDPRAWPLLPLAAWTVLFAFLAVRISARRDDQGAVLGTSTSREPRTWLLGSVLGLTFRDRVGGMTAWVLGTGTSMFALGLLSKTISQIAKTSSGIQRHIEQTTTASVDVASARGYLAIMFIFVVIIVSLHAVGHSNVAADEEQEGRAAAALSGPVSRNDWLGSRVVVQGLGCLLVTLAAVVGAWSGASVVGAPVAFLDMAQAGANIMPVAALFCGIGMATFAFFPRHASAVAWSIVGVAYLWEQTGAILKAPEWVLGFSPFHWVKPVPVVDPAETALTIMAALAVFLIVVSFSQFRSRDLTGG